VTGLDSARGGSGDPSPFTAMGIEAAMRACARVRFGSSELRGLRVAIAGLGHVGANLARRLTAAGATLTVSDIDVRTRAIADALGARWVEPEHELLVECEILAPCALGGAIDGEVLPLLRCDVICGSANNQLAEDALADAIAERGILYAPDYVVNAGGLIHVYREIRGYSEEQAIELVLDIEHTVDRVLEIARAEGIAPLAAAKRLAAERLAGAVRH
jgi:leucine dehydrogenase